MISIFYGFIVLVLSFNQSFSWVSFDMTKRSVAMGKSTQMDARVFFSKSGEMVTYFTSPSEMFVLNDKDGNVRFYDPQKNRVFNRMDRELGSQNTVFYYFLLGNNDDLGLSEVGFELLDTRVEDQMLISNYEAPQNLKNQFRSAELVSDGKNPVFIGYKNEKDEYVKKIYYYDYYELGNIDFPLSITEVDFFQSDSIITKTTFSQFQFDSSSDKEFLQFEIPSDAKLTK